LSLFLLPPHHLFERFASPRADLADSIDTHCLTSCCFPNESLTFHPRRFRRPPVPISRPINHQSLPAITAAKEAQQIGERLKDGEHTVIVVGHWG
jgi:hypothetical protein